MHQLVHETSRDYQKAEIFFGLEKIIFQMNFDQFSTVFYINSFLLITL